MKISEMAVEVDVRKAWWLSPFLYSLVWVQFITGWQPSPKLIGRIVFMGLKAHVKESGKNS